MQRRVYEEYGGVNAAVDRGPEIRVQERPNVVFAKIFGWFGIGLLVTAATSFLVAYLMAYFLGQADMSPEAGAAANLAFSIYLGALIASFVIMMILSFSINYLVAKGNAHLVFPFVLYSVMMGVFVSFFLVIGLPFYVMGEAFGITALVFLGMGLIGYFSKANLNWLGMVVGGLMICLLISGLFFWVMFILIPGSFTIWSLLLSFVISIFCVIAVGMDMQNVKAAVDHGASGRSFEIMSALVFYTDFMQLFVRILYILLIFFGGRERK